MKNFSFFVSRFSRISFVSLMVIPSLVLLFCSACKTHKNIESAASSTAEQVSQSSMLQAMFSQDSSALRQLLSIDSITVEYPLVALTDTALRQQRTKLTPTASGSKIVLRAKGINLNTDRQNAKTVRSLSKSDDTLSVSSASTELTTTATESTGVASPVNTTVLLIAAMVLVLLVLFLCIRSR